MKQDCNIVRFDWKHERVTRGAIVVRVSGQEKILLRLMVENANDVCTRKRLMEAIWGQRAALMDELYLTQLVYRLRKLLRPVDLWACIVTVPRTGYRFVASGLRWEIADHPTKDVPPSRLGPASPVGGTTWAGSLERTLSVRSLRQIWSTRLHSSSPASKQIALPSIDSARGIVSHRGASAHLTRFEQILLRALIEHADQTVGSETLVKMIWGHESGNSFSRLTRLTSRLRRSLEPLKLDRHIQLVHGVGYRFCRTTARPAIRTEAVPVSASTDGCVESMSITVSTARRSSSIKRWWRRPQRPLPWPRHSARLKTQPLAALTCAVLAAAFVTLKLAGLTGAAGPRLYRRSEIQLVATGAMRRFTRHTLPAATLNDYPRTPTGALTSLPAHQ